MADSQRKHRRIDGITSFEDKGVENRPGPKNSKSAPKKVKCGVRKLYEIVGRKGLGPIKYRDLADRFRYDLSLLEILQLSPDTRYSLYKIRIPITKPRQKKKNSQNVPKDSQKNPAFRTASPAPGYTEPEGSRFRSNSQAGSQSSTKKISFAERDSRELDSSKDKFTLINHENSHSFLKVRIPIGPDLYSDNKAFKIPVTFRVRYQGKYTKVSISISMTYGN
jgi:hypothetical protein